MNIHLWHGIFASSHLLWCCSPGQVTVGHGSLSLV